MTLLKIELIEGKITKTLYLYEKLQKEVKAIRKLSYKKVIHYNLEVLGVIHAFIIFDKVAYFYNNEPFSSDSMATFMNDLYFDCLLHLK